MWSLAVVFLVERLLGTALSGIAQLSPMWLGRAVYADFGPTPTIWCAKACRRAWRRSSAWCC